MDFLWIICIFLLAANQSCGCGCADSCGCTDAETLNCGAGRNCGANMFRSGDRNCSVNVSSSADVNCSVNGVGSGDCGCCESDNVVLQNDCSCEAPQPLMPGSNGNTRTAQYPFPPYPVLRNS
ncbi:MAG: hypothetical protein LUH58_06200 [Lachnospiraceae bacterium]|nr:hypothetical protein [Lachnospiraceae bacterium]